MKTDRRSGWSGGGSGAAAAWRGMFRGGLFFPLCLGVVCLSFFVFCLQGENRIKRRPLSEYADPKSPSFVPIPYPANAEQVIRDFRYYVINNECRGAAPVSGPGVSGYDPEKVLPGVFESKPEFKILAVRKVELRLPMYSEDYHWLIYIADKNDDVVSLVSMTAEGLYEGHAVLDCEDYAALKTDATKKNRRRMRYVTEQQVLDRIIETTGKRLTLNDLKKCALVTGNYGSRGFHTPVWEVILKSGEFYYYVENNRQVYTVSRRVPWPRITRFDRKHPASLVPEEEYISDFISDEVIGLKKAGKE